MMNQHFYKNIEKRDNFTGKVEDIFFLNYYTPLSYIIRIYILQKSNTQYYIFPTKRWNLL